ncbi:MMPL family transporter [Paenibacillus yanchengensis]|uniref:MMPL family transporter n=1 Tax=Paenibacillus yanchengensis TaxID=2035833 RepID=A0ABW4YPV1_9BACL
MKTILKFKWVIMALWIVAAIGLMFTAPSMQDLVRTKGQIDVPAGYSSKVATELAKEINAGEGEGSAAGLDTVLVFHKDGGLDQAQIDEVKHTVNQLKEDRESLGITSVTSHYDTAELKDQLVSKDGSSILVMLQVQPGDMELSQVRDNIYTALADTTVDHYMTGDWVIAEDLIQSSEDGLKKTELITIVFILVILFIVFRSALAPFVPLLTVGISYLVSQSIVSFLVEYADFPLSNFTQIFMVAIMFGIGTDYCILLISRYKEELSHGHNRIDAIVNTYRTAGKTVFYAGLAVLIGFTAIGFSTFVLYRSAVAVAVGVAVLLIALYTIVPFFLAVLGKGLFWPAKGSVEHKQSKLWGRVGSFSLKRPVWTLLILAVIIVPPLLAHKGDVSYNSLDEIGEKYSSVKGFNLIADRFGPGETLPASVVLKTDKPMDNSEGLALIEKVTRELSGVDGVKFVRSATRPVGEEMDEFLVADQVTVLDDGLVQSGDGLLQIEGGLSEASNALAENAPQLQDAAKGAEQLISGTNELKTGVSQLSAGLKEIQRGMTEGSTGAKQLHQGLSEARKSAEQLSEAAQQLEASYNELGGGLSQLTDGYQQIASEQMKVAEGLSGAVLQVEALQQTFPELTGDEQYMTALETVKQLQQGASTIGTQLTEMSTQLGIVQAGVTKANEGYSQATAGQSQLAQGLGALVQGIAELEQGLVQAAAGQGKIVAELPNISGGLEQLADGQQQLQAGFASLDGQLGTLTSGLDESVSGLKQIQGGLVTAGDYLQSLSQTADKQMAGWYIPADVTENEQFQMALDMYMSADRKTVKFDVVFESSPYEQQAMEQVEPLQAAANRAIMSTDYANAELAVGGVTSMNHDLKTLSDADYSRTVTFMLIGIAIILIILFRSIVIPLYVILSLIVTYFTSLALTELVFVKVAGLTGLSWPVPFFGFVILIALGVDYSIFLMDRFREYRHLDPKEAILEAMKNMGSVIMSAAVILGGTFAAMLPSGVMSLLQIGTMVLFGLLLYAIIMLPLFIPIMVRMFGVANWWPFMGKESSNDHQKDNQLHM